MSLMTLDQELQAATWENLNRMVILLGQLVERLAHPLVNVEAAAAPIVEVPPFEIPAPVVTVTSPDIDTAPIIAGLQAVMTEQLGRIPDSISSLKDLMRMPSAPGLSLTPLINRIPDLTGSWAVRAGVSGTVSVTATERVVGIAAFAADGAPATVAIGAVTVTIPAGRSIALNPNGQLEGPVDLVFTATTSYVVEVLS